MTQVDPPARIATRRFRLGDLRIVGGLAATAVLIGACGGNSEESTATSSTPTTEAAMRSTTTSMDDASTTTAESEATAGSEATTTTAATGTTDGAGATGGEAAGQKAAANAYLDSLSADQRTQTVFAASELNTMKGAWSNLPAPLFDAREGVKFGDLTEDQRSLALQLVESLTSDQGYEQVLGILAADDYLGTNSSGGGGQQLEWTSDAYRVAIYGDPKAEDNWVVQFGGHHLAMHFASGSGGLVSASPSFTGVEPVTFTYDGKEYSPMVAESEAAFKLINSFTADQATKATISGTFDGIVVGPGEDGNFPATEGIPYSELDADQQKTVAEIIKLWVGDADESISDQLIEEYTAQLAQTTIGWSGGKDQATQGSYLRIDGPRLWIEYSVVPPIGSGEPHFHSIYRDKLIDYGQSTTAAG